MCVDVIDVLGRKVRFLENMTHQARLTLFRRLWKMVTVGVCLHGNDFRIDVCPTFDRRSERFEHHHSASVSRNNALPTHVPRPACSLRLVINTLTSDRTKKGHRMEPHRGEIQHCACHDCGWSIVIANLVYGASKGCVSTGACSADCIDRSADAEDFRDTSGVICIQPM